MSDGWSGAPPAPPARGGALSTTTDASGFVTITHGGPGVPTAVLLSGRNLGYYPYLTALTGTTFTVRFLLRSDGSALTAATPVAFDWGCRFA